MIDKGHIDWGDYPLVADPHLMVQGFPEGEFLHYSIGDRWLVWAATYKSPHPPNTGDVEWIQNRDQQALHRILSKLPTCHPLHLMAKHTIPSRLMHFGLYYRSCDPIWVNRRVVLLGDSAHATLPYVGQGANMAIEDAWILSQSLVNHGMQYQPAFKEYNDLRYPRTSRLVTSARYMGRFLHTQNPLLGYLRNKILPAVLFSKPVMNMIFKEFYRFIKIESESSNK